MNELQQNNETAAIEPTIDSGEIPAFLDRKEDGDVVLEALDTEGKGEGFVQVEEDFQ